MNVVKKIFLWIAMPCLFASCENEILPDTYKWSRIDNHFDSIGCRLERQFYEFSPIDSIESNIRKLSLLCNKNGSCRNVMISRLNFWKSWMHSRKGNLDSAYSYIEKALKLNDSVNHEYDYHKMMLLKCKLNQNIDGVLGFDVYNGAIEYARTVCDRSLEAEALIMLGTLLNHIGEGDRALTSLEHADSLCRQLGYNEMYVKNQINRSTSLINMGRRREAEQLLKEIESHPCILKDVNAHNLILRNIYVLTGEVYYLRKALKEIYTLNNYKDVKGLYYAMMADWAYQRHMSDSVIYYSDLSWENVGYVENFDHLGIIFLNRSRRFVLTSQSDSALKYYIKEMALVDSVRNRNKAYDVLKLRVVQELNLAETRHALEIYRRNMYAALAAVLFVLLGGISFFLVRRRHNRQRIDSMKIEIALEKSRRKATASAVALEEKDNILGIVRDELHGMRIEGRIDDADARRLETAIKSQLSGRYQEKMIQEMYDMITPGFEQKLKARCGNISNNFVKLACYVLMGLDNKHIARLMMVKPESVRQSKWRLGQKLELSDNENLEEVLSHLNSDSVESGKCN